MMIHVIKHNCIQAQGTFLSSVVFCAAIDPDFTNRIYFFVLPGTWSVFTNSTLLHKRGSRVMSALALSSACRRIRQMAEGGESRRLEGWARPHIAIGLCLRRTLQLPVLPQATVRFS